MNRYIFLTTSIRNIGGAQLYISRKKDWLESTGWIVDVYFFNEGDIKIENLIRYQSNCINELLIPYYAVNSKCLDKITKKIRHNEKYSVTMIESHTINLSLIGEEVSKRINAHHLAYWLSESFPMKCLRYKDYFEKKLKDNSLYSISDNTIPIFLGKNDLTKGRGLLAIGCSHGNVEDIEFPYLDNISSASYNILCIGRLDKPYVDTMINKIIFFITKHQNYTFNIIFVGSSADVSIENSIKKRLSVLTNQHTHFLGYIHPIPRKIFQLSNVAISSAGSARVSFKENVKTITIETNDWEPLGVLGYTTKNVLYRENEPKIPLDELLEDILINEKFTAKELKYNFSFKEKLDYTEHQKVIDRVMNSNHYDIIYKRTLKEKLLYAASFICGNDFLVRLFRRLNK